MVKKKSYVFKQTNKQEEEEKQDTIPTTKTSMKYQK